MPFLDVFVSSEDTVYQVLEIDEASKNGVWWAVYLMEIDATK